MPLLVLPALSEQGPDAILTEEPSLAPLLLVKFAAQSARPDVGSLAENLFVTWLVYQPLDPAVPETNPPSVMDGAVVSILMVAVFCDPAAAPVLAGEAPSVAVQLTLWVPSPVTVRLPLAVLVL